MALEDQVLGALAKQQQLRRLPPSAAEKERLWELYKDYRALGRRRMSASTKAKAIRLFGRKMYEAIRW